LRCSRLRFAYGRGASRRGLTAHPSQAFAKTPTKRESRNRSIVVGVRVQATLSDPFEYGRDTLSAADAHGYQGVAAAAVLQLIHRLHRKQAAGGAEG
jgi:hypothetical protein